MVFPFWMLMWNFPPSHLELFAVLMAAGLMAAWAGCMLGLECALYGRGVVTTGFSSWHVPIVRGWRFFFRQLSGCKLAGDPMPRQSLRACCAAIGRCLALCQARCSLLALCCGDMTVLCQASFLYTVRWYMHMATRGKLLVYGMLWHSYGQGLWLFAIAVHSWRLSNCVIVLSWQCEKKTTTVTMWEKRPLLLLPKHLVFMLVGI